MKKQIIALVAVIFGGAIIASTNTAGALSAANCGSGYSHVNTERLQHYGSNGSRTPGPAVQKLFVKRVNGDWRWCMFTEHTGNAVGVAAPTSAKIGRALSANYADSDSGNFAYYAGPVYVTTSKKRVSTLSQLTFNDRSYIVRSTLSYN